MAASAASVTLPKPPPPHPALMFAALITFAQVATSALIRVANSSDALPTISLPSSACRSFISGADIRESSPDQELDAGAGGSGSQKLDAFEMRQGLKSVQALVADASEIQIEFAQVGEGGGRRSPCSRGAAENDRER